MQSNPYLQDAVKEYQCKRYKEAIIKASKGLDMQKHDFHLLHLRANCLTALKDDKNALMDLKLLIKVYPSEPRAYLKGAKCYTNLGQSNNALKILEYGRTRVDKNDPKYQELEEKEYELHSRSENRINTKIRREKNYNQIKEKGKPMILPVELMTIVLWYLPQHDRFRISRVSQYWRSIVKGTTLLWRDIDLEPYSRKIDKKAFEIIINTTKDRVFKLSLKNCSLMTDLKSLITHRCRNVVYLDLTCTRVNSSALIEALKCMGKSLKDLILEDTRADNACLRRVFDICRSLKVLNISKCPLITNEGFTICDKFKKANVSLCLTELLITNMSDLSDSSIARVINSAPFLQGIDLSGCNRISSEVLNILSQNSKWKWMVFGGNSFSSNFFKDGLLKLICNCSQLERLELPKIPFIDDFILSMIAKSCPMLNHINLKGCAHISSSGIIKLSKLSLRVINLSKCPKISENAILMLLESNTSLESIDVSSVSDNLLEAIKKNAYIHSLYISDGTITNRGMIELSEKSGVAWQNIHFSNCQKLSREAISHLSSVLKRCKVTAYFS